MILGRKLTPVLVVFLLLRGGLAVLPHQHSHAETQGPELTVVSADGARHDCLACSIHAPAMEGSEGPSSDAGFTDVCSASVDAPPVLGAALVGDASPRGPPSIV